MPNIGQYLQEVRSVALALRIIAFEKSDATAAVLWTAVTLIVLLPVAAVSDKGALALLFAAAVMFLGFRKWFRTQRYRLIRIADRVEFADYETDTDDVMQRFEKGVVLQRLKRDDAERAGISQRAIMDDQLWYYLVKTPERTAVVPFEWIVAIEIDEEME